ncbi:MAG: zinc ribbon domain-containing protein [Chloroflexi bacterium]|nr:MAG: zinc ribbon domain-containing protein [Chloroflexota bacterium]MBL1194948.1 zinc ribbon domain-containing protein [Chloroflexota bacterium]NOH12238.1 zinc ribbon domain-containing protein [Chloroflexota bacterium]
MNTSTILIGIAFLLITIPIVANPLLGRKGLPTFFGHSTSHSTSHKKQAPLLALQDLDFDYQLGKVAEDDYQRARAGLLEQAAAAIEESEQAADARLEQLIRKRRADLSQPISKTCSNCEETVKDSDHFCPYCGAQLTASCPSCGEEFAEEDTFCSSCGVPLKEQQPN